MKKSLFIAMLIFGAVSLSGCSKIQEYIPGLFNNAEPTPAQHQVREIIVRPTSAPVTTTPTPEPTATPIPTPFVAEPVVVKKDPEPVATATPTPISTDTRTAQITVGDQTINLPAKDKWKYSQTSDDAVVVKVSGFTGDIMYKDSHLSISNEISEVIDQYGYWGEYYDTEVTEFTNNDRKCYAYVSNKDGWYNALILQDVGASNYIEITMSWYDTATKSSAYKKYLVP